MDETTVRRFDQLALKRLRKRASMTQVMLAQSSGIPIDTVRDYEQGRSTPSVERLFLLATWLDCSMDDFATDGGTDSDS